MPISDAPPLTRFLARLLRHSALSEEEQEVILSLNGQTVLASARRDIICPRTVDHASLVADGLVGRFEQMQDGERQITAIFIPGDLCDLHSVVCPTAEWALEAFGEAKILLLAHRDLRAVAMKHPAIAMAFWRDTVVDASILAKWVGNLGRRNARSRLAHLLCEIGLRIEQARLGSRTTFDFPITQTQLGDALGLSSVHVNRMIQALRRAELIERFDRRILIKDWDRLVAIAEFDPAFLLGDSAIDRIHDEPAGRFRSQENLRT